jgi:hypothetical protein
LAPINPEPRTAIFMNAMILHERAASGAAKIT